MNSIYIKKQQQELLHHRTQRVTSTEQIASNEVPDTANRSATATKFIPDMNQGTSFIWTRVCRSTITYDRSTASNVKEKRSNDGAK
ncbi:hypothetical protein N9D38_11845 [Rubripirellula sp.]|nr:hypothetical protein [Rubripirellula sp.]